MQIRFPFQIDSSGRTALADEEAHVRQLIEQLLFTSAGERVNRPEMGSGILQLVFAPNSAELASATQFQVQGALQQYLDELIQVSSVQVRAEEGALIVEVAYVLRRGERPQAARFVQEIP